MMRWDNVMEKRLFCVEDVVFVVCCVGLLRFVPVYNTMMMIMYSRDINQFLQTNFIRTTKRQHSSTKIICKF